MTSQILIFIQMKIKIMWSRNIFKLSRIRRIKSFLKIPEKNIKSPFRKNSTHCYQLHFDFLTTNQVPSMLYFGKLAQDLLGEPVFCVCTYVFLLKKSIVSCLRFEKVRSRNIEMRRSTCSSVYGTLTGIAVCTYM